MIKIYEPEVYCIEKDQISDYEELLKFFEDGHLNNYIIMNNNGIFSEVLDYYCVLFQKSGQRNFVYNLENAFEQAETFFRNNENKNTILPILNSDDVVISFFQWDDILPSISRKPTLLPQDFEIIKDLKEIILYNCDEYNWHILNGLLETNETKNIILTGLGWDLFQNTSLIKKSANIFYKNKEDIIIDDSVIVISSKTSEEMLNISKGRFLNGKLLMDLILRKEKICVFLSDDFEKDQELWNKVQPLTDNIQITAFLTNNKKLVGQEMDGIHIHYIHDLRYMKYDKILICCKIGGDENLFQKINQLVCGYHIDYNVIDEFYWGIVKLKLFYQYRTTKDIELLELINHLKHNYGSIWGPYLKDYTSQAWPVYWDDTSGYPYIVFENKRMYFPHSYHNFVMNNGQMYVCDILLEQHTSSPHLYCKDEVIIKDGDVVVDAGVCEGNFSLRYIDLISKLYLVECDPLWEEPLKLTFAPYKEKVVFCNKFLTNFNDDTHITLDQLVTEDVNFLKMDIEGEEPKALEGAQRLLSNENIRLSICTYHKIGQYQDIKKMLEKNGFTTTHSNGFMLFCEDPDFAKTADPRRGIIRAWKDQNIS